MSTYELKAINFIAGGPITVRDLSDLGLIPDGQTPLPNKLQEMGWAIWLPMSSISLLPFFSDGIARGLNADELLIYLNEKVKPDTFILNERDQRFIGEFQIKRRLELNGYQYPMSVVDVVDLYIKLGMGKIVFDETTGNACYDLVIRHLDHVDSVLKLK